MPSARVHISGLGPDESETAPGAVDAPVPPFEFYTSTIEPSASGFALAAILEASLEHVTREADAPTCPHAYVHLWDLRKCDKCGADVGDDRREPKAKEEGLRPTWSGLMKAVLNPKVLLRSHHRQRVSA